MYVSAWGNPIVRQGYSSIAGLPYARSAPGLPYASLGIGPGSFSYSAPPVMTMEEVVVDSGGSQQTASGGGGGGGSASSYFSPESITSYASAGGRIVSDILSAMRGGSGASIAPSAPAPRGTNLTPILLIAGAGIGVILIVKLLKKRS